LHLEYEHPAGDFESFKGRAAAAQDDHCREAPEQVARLRITDRERSAEPARRLVPGDAVLGCAAARVGDVVRVAARDKDEITAAHALDARIAVNPKRELALFNDVQAANIGEADRESPRRSVRNDPFSAQTDAPEQLREQVVRAAIRAKAKLDVLTRWRIGKLSRRLEQIDWRRWTISKISRRSGHGRCLFL